MFSFENCRNIKAVPNASEFFVNTPIIRYNGRAMAVVFEVGRLIFPD
jgi:hypothetical protein